MTDTIKVPDIGDFKDVPVIEVYVKPGQTIAAEDTLITLESDKATHGRSRALGRDHRRGQGQGRRQGERGLGHRDVRRCGCREGSTGGCSAGHRNFSCDLQRAIFMPRCL